MKNTLLLIVLLFWGACSSTPNYTMYEYLKNPQKRGREPDLTTYPRLLQSRPKLKVKEISWPGYLDKVYSKKDKNGRMVLKITHHFLAIDSFAFRKDKKNIIFEMSEISGGKFECRIPFNRDLPKRDHWQDYIDRFKALGCTGKIIGYNTKGHPIIEARLLEGIPIDRVTKFEPEYESQNGRVILDEHGRPKYKSVNYTQ